jgi:hypothetical protein
MSDDKFDTLCLFGFLAILVICDAVASVHKQERIVAEPPAHVVIEKTPATHAQD